MKPCLGKPWQGFALHTHVHTHKKENPMPEIEPEIDWTYGYPYEVKPCIHEGLFSDDRGPDATRRCYQCGVDVPNRDL